MNVKLLMTSITILLAFDSVNAGSFKPDDAMLTPVNDFASGSAVIAKIIAVTDKTITARSLSTGYEKKLGGRMSPDMIGKCISVVRLSETKSDVNPVACPPSRDTSAKAELKRKLDAAAKAK